MLDPFETLSTMGFGAWSSTKLKGDASSRQFLRLKNDDGETAIAMHTPADLANSQTTFLQIAEHLLAHGISAPQVFAQDIDAGLIVLQDLGPTDLANELYQNPSNQAEYYEAAIDVIVALRGASVPEKLVVLTADVAIEMLGPFFDFYAPMVTATQKQEITEVFLNILVAALDTQPALALRDYHAENLIWRPEHSGLDRIGVLDFQDAFSAPSEYDLASLLRDARRDVPQDIHDTSIVFFAQSTGQSTETVALRCAVLAVQRNLRILGIFTRLARQDGKPSYLQLIPRVEDYIVLDLQHPALGSLRPLIMPLLKGTTT